MPGTVLLLAASPLGRGRLVDAASVLPVLAAVSPAVLAGTDTANVVELADPLQPQAVLTRLRAAAAAPGPLTVYVTGQLQLDRRQRLPHLALARTTASTVRYTAFPWHWFREELRLRPTGATTLFLDLHADPETWQALRAPRPPGPGPVSLDCGRDNAVYGRVAPPPSRRGVAEPAYMKAVATILRSGRRPPDEELHQQAARHRPPESTRPRDRAGRGATTSARCTPAGTGRRRRRPGRPVPPPRRPPAPHGPRRGGPGRLPHRSRSPYGPGHDDPGTGSGAAAGVKVGVCRTGGPGRGPGPSARPARTVGPVVRRTVSVVPGRLRCACRGGPATEVPGPGSGAAAGGAGPGRSPARSGAGGGLVRAPVARAVRGPGARSSRRTRRAGAIGPGLPGPRSSGAPRAVSVSPARAGRGAGAGGGRGCVSAWAGRVVGAPAGR
ncbi:hypothetical protein SGRIM128S_04233 [Streptomyces griseomycini]